MDWAPDPLRRSGPGCAIVPGAAEWTGRWRRNDTGPLTSHLTLTSHVSRDQPAPIRGPGAIVLLVSGRHYGTKGLAGAAIADHDHRRVGQGQERQDRELPSRVGPSRPRAVALAASADGPGLSRPNAADRRRGGIPAESHVSSRDLPLRRIGADRRLHGTHRNLVRRGPTGWTVGRSAVSRTHAGHGLEQRPTLAGRVVSP